MEGPFPLAPVPGDPPRARHRTAEPTSLPDASAPNDDAVLTVLRRDLGEAVFRDVLAGLDDEMARRLRSVQEEPWDWHGIRDDARAMLSLAAGFGFSTLAALSRTILSACECPAHRSPEVLRPYVAEVNRRRSTIAALNHTVGVATRPEGHGR